MRRSYSRRALFTAGAGAARFAFQVRRYFGDDIDYLLPGSLGGDRSPSMIRDLNSDTIIRP